MVGFSQPASGGDTNWGQGSGWGSTPAGNPTAPVSSPAPVSPPTPAPTYGGSLYQLGTGTSGGTTPYVPSIVKTNQEPQKPKIVYGVSSAPETKQVLLPATVIKGLGSEDTEKQPLTPEGDLDLNRAEFANKDVKGTSGANLYEYYVRPESGSFVELYSGESQRVIDVPMYATDIYGRPKLLETTEKKLVYERGRFFRVPENQGWVQVGTPYEAAVAQIPTQEIKPPVSLFSTEMQRRELSQNIPLGAAAPGTQTVVQTPQKGLYQIEQEKKRFEGAGMAAPPYTGIAGVYTPRPGYYPIISSSGIRKAALFEVKEPSLFQREYPKLIAERQIELAKGDWADKSFRELTKGAYEPKKGEEYITAMSQETVKQGFLAPTRIIETSYQLSPIYQTYTFSKGLYEGKPVQETLGETYKPYLSIGSLALGAVVSQFNFASENMVRLAKRDIAGIGSSVALATSSIVASATNPRFVGGLIGQTAVSAGMLSGMFSPYKSVAYEGEYSKMITERAPTYTKGVEYGTVVSRQKVNLGILGKPTVEKQAVAFGAEFKVEPYQEGKAIQYSKGYVYDVQTGKFGEVSGRIIAEPEKLLPGYASPTVYGKAKVGQLFSSESIEVMKDTSVSYSKGMVQSVYKGTNIYGQPSEIVRGYSIPTSGTSKTPTLFKGEIIDLTKTAEVRPFTWRFPDGEYRITFPTESKPPTPTISAVSPGDITITGGTKVQGTTQLFGTSTQTFLAPSVSAQKASMALSEATKAVTSQVSTAAILSIPITSFRTTPKIVTKPIMTVREISTPAITPSFSYKTQTKELSLETQINPPKISEIVSLKPSDVIIPKTPTTITPYSPAVEQPKPIEYIESKLVITEQISEFQITNYPPYPPSPPVPTTMMPPFEPPPTKSGGGIGLPSLPSLFSQYQKRPGVQGKKQKKKYKPSIIAEQLGIYGTEKQGMKGGGVGLRPLLRKPQKPMRVKKPVKGKKLKFPWEK